MTLSITRRTAKALAAAAIALPILAGTSLSFAQGTPAPAAPAAPLATAATPPAPAADAPETLEIGALRDMSRIAIKGRVAEVFGDTFIVEDASGRALVETGPGRKGGAKVAVGETVTVEGRFGRGTFQAAAIVHEDGRREALRDPRGPGRDGREDGDRRADRDGPDGRDGPRGPGHHKKHHDGPRAEKDDEKGGVLGWFSGGVDEAAATKTVTDAGYSDVSLVDTGPRHAEFRAKDAAGAEWSVKVDDDGEIAEREPYKAEMTEAEAKSAVEKLGYTYEGDFEARREHVEVEAKDKAGKTVVVELNTDGSLRKERFDN
ncbi:MULTISPECIES: hypothetical protein [unclassified Aureimonas]|uniref:hypothetical protein n=1 Tax=unclassified Aureimonas TaxID=2615206 RepID=UPI0006FE607F|nr:MULTISPECIES: hypothetical protein [unclassified Aureimonas]KQT57313.1 hypothetical protein ASG62_08160 [Aureimonas sp. Leaf427]KQT76993.1 hypothetical protein ASG54_12025 [Aureimonas sp. Leaf460]